MRYNCPEVRLQAVFHSLYCYSTASRKSNKVLEYASTEAVELSVSVVKCLRQAHVTCGSERCPHRPSPEGQGESTFVIRRPARP